VIIDPNIANNQGAGTNEDDVYVLDAQEVQLAEGPLRTRVLQEVLSGTLQIRIQAVGFSAFASSRRPKTIARISGAGARDPDLPEHVPGVASVVISSRRTPGQRAAESLRETDSRRGRCSRRPLRHGRCSLDQRPPRPAAGPLSRWSRLDGCFA
jgi:hypothetical protein